MSREHNEACPSENTDSRYDARGHSSLVMESTAGKGGWGGQAAWSSLLKSGHLLVSACAGGPRGFFCLLGPCFGVTRHLQLVLQLS